MLFDIIPTKVKVGTYKRTFVAMTFGYQVPLKVKRYTKVPSYLGRYLVTEGTYLEGR